MDDLTRIFGEGKCSCNDCVPDPDPATDYDMPGDLRFGSRAWLKAMDSRTDDRLDFTLSDPEDGNDWLDEGDEIDFDRPDLDDELWWSEATRDQACAAELMLAAAQTLSDYEQSNNYLDILSEGRPEDVDRWFNRDVTEF